MKNKIGVATTTYANYNSKEAIEGISKAGFKYIELASIPMYFEHIPRPEVKVDKKITEIVLKDCREHGLELHCISGLLRLMKEKGVENLKKIIDFAKLSEVKFITTDTGEVKDKNDEKKFYRDIEEIADYAKDNDVTVCLEILGNWLNSGKIGAEIIKKINHPNIKLNYDTANVIFYGGIMPETDLLHALPYIGFIHLKDHGSGKIKDWNFPPLGDGIIDFKKIFKMIEKYNGPCCVEIEFDGSKHPLEEINLAVLKSYDFLKKYEMV